MIIYVVRLINLQVIEVICLYLHDLYSLNCVWSPFTSYTDKQQWPRCWAPVGHRYFFFPPLLQTAWAPPTQPPPPLPHTERGNLIQTCVVLLCSLPSTRRPGDRVWESCQTSHGSTVKNTCIPLLIIYWWPLFPLCLWGERPPCGPARWPLGSAGLSKKLPVPSNLVRFPKKDTLTHCCARIISAASSGFWITTYCSPIDL